MHESEQWAQISALFHACANVDQAERESLLGAPQLDTRMVAAVRRLLREDASAQPLLDAGVGPIVASLLLTATALGAGQSVGPYRIIRILGDGGMGRVFAAQREDVGAVVALKVLRDAVPSPARRALFVRERRTLARLRHSAIAQLFDAGTLADGTPWFAMELVDGMLITAWCRTHQLRVNERLRLFRTVCEAVSFAHGQLVVHGDIKPSNLMVTSEGAVKLLDFGVAARLDVSSDTPDEGHDGTLLSHGHTPGYASPEQLAGSAANVASDVYSLGVVLREMLTEVPESARSAGDVTMESTTGAAEGRDSPSDVARRFPQAWHAGAWWPDLDAIVRRATAPDPALRYPSADALARELDRYLEGRAVSALTPDTLYRARKYLRMHWRGVVAVVSVVAIAASATTAFVRGLARARRDAEAEAARARRAELFAFRLFEGGEDGEAPPESLRVLDLLERGVQEASLLSADRRAQSEALSRLAGIYVRLQMLDKGDSLLRRVVGLQAAHGRATSQWGAALSGLAVIETERSEYAAAERLAREALDTLRASGSATPTAMAEAETALGNVFYWSGAYASADSVLRTAMSRLAAAGDTTGTAYVDALNALANTMDGMGRLDSADVLNRRLLTASRRTYGDRHPNVAIDLINIGQGLASRGEYEAAIGLLREGVDITAHWFGEGHVRTAMAQTILARALAPVNQLEEARTLFERALAISERVRGPTHRAVGNLHLDLGNVARLQSRYDDAEREYRRALGIYQVTLGPRSEFAAVAMSELAAVQLGREQWRDAERGFREVLTLLREIFPGDHLRVADAQIRLGRALLREGRVMEAERESRAGYEMVRRLASPGHVLLEAARADLAESYTKLGRADEADRFRRELVEHPPRIPSRK